MWRRFLIFSLILFPFSSPAEKASQLYLSQDYANCIKVLKREREEPSYLYLLGLCYLKAGRYRDARNSFRKMIKKRPSSEYVIPSLIKLGDAYFLEGRWKKAEAAYKVVLEKGKRRFLPLVYLRLAQIYAKRGEWLKEKEFISKIKSEYPQSIEKKFADILEERGFFFTIQVGAFTSYRNALSLLKELKKNYPAYLVKEKKRNFLFYKVRVGRFKEKEVAQKVYKRLIEEGYPASLYP
ncbi:MAG: hypothetical protein DRP76_01785 [Candidatus Omnitrophota bacterium]|nr:MAG: hypothetical protein DRP76_01785 [Candidatus Omnitrophota bacterium]